MQQELVRPEPILSNKIYHLVLEYVILGLLSKYIITPLIMARSLKFQKAYFTNILSMIMCEYHQATNSLVCYLVKINGLVHLSKC